MLQSSFQEEVTELFYCFSFKSKTNDSLDSYGEYSFYHYNDKVLDLMTETSQLLHWDFVPMKTIINYLQSSNHKILV